MKKTTWGITALALVSALALSACGNTDPVKSDSPDTTTNTEPSAAAQATYSGTLAGAGASSQESAMNAWRAGFQTANPDIEVSYDAVGSGAGIEQLLSGQVPFAGSDEALGAEDLEKSKAQCGGESAINIPVYISPVAVAFNLEGVDTINMSPAQIADVFNGKITKWNDPSLVEANPGVTLPDMAITTVHRADKSGTTENFTAFLNEVAPENWPYEASKEWPVASGDSAQQTSGVIQALQDGKGIIGYADASKVGSLGTVALKVGAEYVKFSTEAAGKAVETAAIEEGRAANDLALKLDRKTDAAGAYPLILVSYLIACPTYAEAQTADNVRGFMEFIVSDEGQKLAEKEAGSAPLPGATAEKAKAAIATIAAK
ncbi:MAG: phosphate ABC transporter substrate-binding protein PstS [Actinomycetaceae bacterium]|nr:phosphate ABC transporter substrate-binding protein PstS [Actinomycetaceae bacterium]